MKRSQIVTLAVAALLAALLVPLVRNALRPPAAPRLAAREPLTVGLKGGTTRPLAPPPGKVLIVHFWATWCAPCVEEIPGLVAYVRDTKGRSDLEVLTVSVDEKWETVEPWLAAHGAADLPLALDPKKEAATRMGTLKFPETYVLSSTGAVLLHLVGPADWTSPAVRRRIDDVIPAASRYPAARG
jgi:thiol-disulfide isomerase/thioredoxin